MKTDTANTDIDGYLLVSGTQHPFQIAEIMEPGRRRGDELKNEHGITAHYDPDEARRSAAEWIARGIEAKAAKRYANGGKLNLLVYANFDAPVISITDVRGAVEEASNSFASVWILTATHIGCARGNNELGNLHFWAKLP
jgi:hypothetical protein